MYFTLPFRVKIDLRKLIKLLREDVKENPTCGGELLAKRIMECQKSEE